MITNIHHRIQAMLLAETPLNENDHYIIKHHLAKCADCRGHAELVKHLEAGQWSPYRRIFLSPVEKEKIALTLQFHPRKQPVRYTNFYSLLGWSSLILILVITLSWAINTLPQNSPSSMGMTSPVEITQTANASRTPLPKETLESNSLIPPPTPDVSKASDFAFESGYQNATEVKLVDLDCDGQNEKLLTAYRVSTNSQQEENLVRDYLGVAVQAPDDDGSYQSAWASTFDHSSRDGLYHVTLIPIDDCEQLLAIDGQTWQGNVGSHSLTVFRWDGIAMKAIFEVPEGLVDLPDYRTPPSGDLTITTFTWGFPDPVRHTCDWTYHRYTWDGFTFKLVDGWQQQEQTCGGAGG